LKNSILPVCLLEEIGLEHPWHRAGNGRSPYPVTEDFTLLPRDHGIQVPGSGTAHLRTQSAWPR
jgi:hypothetical protein